MTLVEGDLKAPFSIGVGEGTSLFPELFHFTLDPYLILLSVKQGGIKNHFLSHWYDLTWDWNQVFWAIDEHSNHYANMNMLVKAKISIKNSVTFSKLPVLD